MDFTIKFDLTEKLALAIDTLSAAISGAGAAKQHHEEVQVNQPAPAQQSIATPASQTAVAVSATPPPVNAVYALPTTPQPAPVIPTAAPQPVQVAAPAPVPVIPTAAAPAYTIDQLAQAGSSLVDMGKVGELLGLLGKYNARAINELPQAHYGAFATELRAMGAQI